MHNNTVTPEVQAQIDELVARWVTSREEGVLRELCRIGHEANWDPYEYRKLLIERGAAPSVASVIKNILSHTDIVQKFLAGASWRNAMHQARQLAENRVRVLVASLLRQARQLASLAQDSQAASTVVTILGQSQSGWTIALDSARQFKITHTDGRELCLVRNHFKPSVQ